MLSDFQQNDVCIAVYAQFDDVLRMPGFFTLTPNPVARALPVYGATRLRGFEQRFGIHPGDHEYVAGFSVLRNRRDQSLVVEVNVA